MGIGRPERIQRAGWNPWVALRELEHAETAHLSLPEGVVGASVPYPGRPVILLDDGLTQVERNAVLAHELIHLERGGSCAASTWRDEEAVEDEVARRLVPLNELHGWVVTRELDEAQVEVWHVADEFHVPQYVAERAMRLLMCVVREDVV